MSLAYVKSFGSLLFQPFSGSLESRTVDIQSPFYKPKYFSEMIRGMTRRHRPSFRKTIAPAEAQVTFSETDLQHWQSFVNHSVEQVAAPLTCYSSAGAFCLFKILGDLKINFSTILHLRANLQLTAPLETVSPDSIYRLRMALADVIPRNKQCILVIETQLLDSKDNIVRQHQDLWFVKKCPERFLKGVAATEQHSIDEFRGLSKKDSNWSQWTESKLSVREHRLDRLAGQHFGRISGDHNIIHTTHWGARFCGQKRPFLQGFGLMNLALHHASQVKEAPVNAMSITFARPALVDQRLNFYFSPLTFEICGENRDLIAFGTYS